jgi:hypothetical protein
MLDKARYECSLGRMYLQAPYFIGIRLGVQITVADIGLASRPRVNSRVVLYDSTRFIELSIFVEIHHLSVD